MSAPAKTNCLSFSPRRSLLGVWGSQAFADDAQIAKLQAEIRRIEAHQQAEISALRAEIHHLKHRGGAVYATKGDPQPPALGRM